MADVLLCVLVESHGADALSKCQQRAVDVSCFLQTISSVVSTRAALWARQVAQHQPRQHHENNDSHPTALPAEVTTVEYKLSVVLANAEDSGNSDVVDSEDPDGEDAVAAESKHIKTADIHHHNNNGNSFISYISYNLKF